MSATNLKDASQSYRCLQCHNLAMNCDYTGLKILRIYRDTTTADGGDKVRSHIDSSEVYLRLSLILTLVIYKLTRARAALYPPLLSGL